KATVECLSHPKTVSDRLDPGASMTTPGSEAPFFASAPARQTRGPLGYRMVRALIRLLLWLFYRRIDVVGRERIPDRGGVIVAANHHNSVVGAMLIIANVPRAITA